MHIRGYALILMVVALLLLWTICPRREKEENVVVIRCPRFSGFECTRNQQTVVSFAVEAKDIDGTDLSEKVRCSHDSGSAFALGRTEVLCSVNSRTSNGNANAHTASCSFDIDVQDHTPPFILCPVEHIQDCSAPKPFVPFVWDSCSSTRYVCTPPSGSLGIIGSWVICIANDTQGNTAVCAFQYTCREYDVFAGIPMGTCTATDVNGNVSPCTFVYEIYCPPPELHIPNLPAVSAMNARGAGVPFVVDVTDDCGLPTLSCWRSDGEPSVGRWFPIGFTNVTCISCNKFDDRSSCSAEGTFTVTVTRSTELRIIHCDGNTID